MDCMAERVVLGFPRKKTGSICIKLITTYSENKLFFTDLTDISGIHFGEIDDCTSSNPGSYFYQLEVTELEGSVSGNLRVATVQNYNKYDVSGSCSHIRSYV